ncbi:bifunctional diaminohydroxyphosphoribosylaminopyrimidine deaminase/5-amino-6-(5-phosphoribosylamino)uracil reductase RibD [Salinimonas marina]|uniref:Riboflavin biosynthesis protein RibD n=1 Tax=Salinimonas marina TaxID=2785918 RepID=A0A7S9HDW8_9ALTE|nr:bifunctional diaminohydroxyphosphoribosylaminopyrimidine deaminase/5-amino-6-(5-phosphoribosylamino)uracil reductase RibD [Salinimonas marina]QPG06589.1 bifunctional diaminohydroxyphosphoribosylaminopyrimidine deaminase/5-amino-6-(5-phosphoribosylamino)uracil reductase RibD [Salinimonas marina]
MKTCATLTESLADDYRWMAQAIALARRGLYTTSPNPRVGCVIVDENQAKVGEGYHVQAGTPHAEVHALAMAAEKARNGTAYVTLEPCSHYGRTPPCADALVNAGVRRVVIAMTDPNPQVSGRGIAKLQQAGIQVSCDILAAEAAKLNRGFIKRMVTNKPYVTVKLAVSLDGKIALGNGVSQWITGPQARKNVQRHRAASCAVLTGTGTARTDNPSLLVRPEEAQFDHYPLPDIRQPLRVVVDRSNKLDPALQLFTDQHPTIQVVGDDLPVQSGQLPVATSGKHINLTELMLVLGARNLNEVWVEAGPALAGALLMSGEVDELIVYQAPKLLGNTAQSMVTLPAFSELSQAIDLVLVEQVQLGQDLKQTFKIKAF